jgi:HEPN domain-containing protein
MKPPEAALRSLVLQRLQKAATDLDAAEQLCAEGRFREIVAFHCQQATEK